MVSSKESDLELKFCMQSMRWQLQQKTIEVLDYSSRKVEIECLLFYPPRRQRWTTRNWKLWLREENLVNRISTAGSRKQGHGRATDKDGHVSHRDGHLTYKNVHDQRYLVEIEALLCGRLVGYEVVENVPSQPLSRASQCCCALSGDGPERQPLLVLAAWEISLSDPLPHPRSTSTRSHLTSRPLLLLSNNYSCFPLKASL